MRYRVEQLAAACEVSVDTVRYYQSRSLLPQPEREGRVAWYDDVHAERIRRIRDLLYEQGFTINGARNRLETETFDSTPERGDGGVPGPAARRTTALSPDQLRQVIEEIRQLLGAGG